VQRYLSQSWAHRVVNHLFYDVFWILQLHSDRIVLQHRSGGFRCPHGHVGDVWLQVLEQIRGDALLPWECELSRKHARYLGALKGPVLQLLHRDPQMRVSMKSFHAACIHLVSGRTTADASGVQ
jgi:hypothetical protein